MLVAIGKVAVGKEDGLVLVILIEHPEADEPLSRGIAIGMMSKRRSHGTRILI